MPYFISKACTKCGACLPECPTASIIEGKTRFHIDTDTCAEHTSCVSVCPVDAISTQQEVYEKPKPDLMSEKKNLSR